MRKRKHYAIAPRRKENSMVSIGYIPRAVSRCNLKRDILTFFDIMVYICDRFVFTTSGTGRKFVEPFDPLGINSDEGSIFPRSAESFLSSPLTAVCRYLLV